MSFECHHLDKWVFANLDLCEEQLELGKHKALVLISGASSSGKSFAAQYLAEILKNSQHKLITISLDMYNFGLSGIIPNKVNKNYFDGKLPKMEEIRNIIKDIIYDIPFEKKYDRTSLNKIKKALNQYMSGSDLTKFIKGLSEEWAKLNFDEPSVYDLEEAAKDIHLLFENKTIKEKKYSKIVSERVDSKHRIDGSDCDIIVVEGIYSLTNEFLNLLEDLNPIKNFIDGNPKSLFLRRILRDKVSTSAPSTFTIKNYFKFIIPSYEETILPARNHADIILNNEMTFLELREGPLYSIRDTFEVTNNEGLKYLKEHSHIIYEHYEKDSYFGVLNEISRGDNILRFREISKDKGLTYEPFSLIHKGINKLRKDGRIIRAVNVLLDEKEVKEVWQTEDSCLLDFSRAGFIIKKIEKKVKTRIIYKNQSFTLFEVEGKKAYIEIHNPCEEKILVEIKKLLTSE